MILYIRGSEGSAVIPVEVKSSSTIADVKVKAGLPSDTYLSFAGTPLSDKDMLADIGIGAEAFLDVNNLESFEMVFTSLTFDHNYYTEILSSVEDKHTFNILPKTDHDTPINHIQFFEQGPDGILTDSTDPYYVSFPNNNTIRFTYTRGKQFQAVVVVNYGHCEWEDDDADIYTIKPDMPQIQRLEKGVQDSLGLYDCAIIIRINYPPKEE